MSKSTSILARLTPKDIERFHTKYSAGQGPDGCYLWDMKGEGYGTFWLDGYTEKAHRVAMVIVTGKDIPEGHEVLHSVCHRPRCVRPDHLSLGTHEENMAEAVQLSEDKRKARALAHWKGEPVEPVSEVVAVSFLAWGWKAAHEKRKLLAPPVDKGERWLLRKLLEYTSERVAFLAVCEVVAAWEYFVPFAVEQYTLWDVNFHSGVAFAPARPLLAAPKHGVTKWLAAVVAFWVERDAARSEQPQEVVSWAEKERSSRKRIAEQQAASEAAEKKLRKEKPFLFEE